MMECDEIMFDTTDLGPVDRGIPVSFERAHNWLGGVLGDDLHSKRVRSIAAATTGLLVGGIASITVIGRGWRSLRA